MANILVCIENDDLQLEDYAYYEAIRPAFVKRHHHLEITSCAEVWDKLLTEPVEALLLFIHSRHSCCWKIARRLWNEWSTLPIRPRVFVLVERRFEEFNEAVRNYLIYHRDQPDGKDEFAQLLIDAESLDEEPYYYVEDEYFPLHSGFLKTFKWPGYYGG
jgi:hypothetical protein